MKKTINNKQSAINNLSFTLVEVLVFMGMFSIIIFVLTDIFTLTLKLQTEQTGLSRVEEDVRYITNRMNFDMLRAEDISQPIAIGTTGILMQIQIDNIDYSYSLNSTDLVLTNDSGSYVLNSYDTSISNLSFTRLGNLNGKNTIKMAFSIKDKNVHSVEIQPKNYQIIFGLR